MIPSDIRSYSSIPRGLPMSSLQDNCSEACGKLLVRTLGQMLALGVSGMRIIYHSRLFSPVAATIAAAVFKEWAPRSNDVNG